MKLWQRTPVHLLLNLFTSGPSAGESVPPSSPAPEGTRPLSNPRLTTQKRKSPFAEGARAVLARIGKMLRRDPLSTFLLFAGIALIIAFFSLLGSLGPEAQGRKVPLSGITQLAEGGLLRTATLLDYDHQAAVETKGDLRLYADYPASDAATQQIFETLTKGGTRVQVNPQSGKSARVIVVQFLMPILILVCLFVFFIRQAGRRRRWHRRLLGVPRQGQEAQEGRERADHLRRGRRRRRSRLPSCARSATSSTTRANTQPSAPRAPKGVLLVGPPGTGKTLLARATAGEADAAFFSPPALSSSSRWSGSARRAIRDLFAKARKAAPAIVFIDELDAAGRKRGAGVGQGNDEREQTLNELLVEMDGFGGDAGIVVMGATNRPDILDPALLRPGRFDRQVTVDVPDVHGRYEILAAARRSGAPSPTASTSHEIAKLSPGFSGAELANLVNEAALLTVREGHTEIDQPTLEEAIDRVVAGPAKKTHILTEDERWRISIHEASHAVATRAIGQVVSAQKLSIVARGRQLGTAAHMLTDRDAVMHSKSRPAAPPDRDPRRHRRRGDRVRRGVDRLDRRPPRGDQAGAAMVTSYGMSEKLGPVTIGEAGGEVFLGAALQDLGSVGPDTLDVIDQETERFVEDAERAGRARCCGPTGARCTRPRTRCSSTRRSPASPSTPCSRR